MSIPQIQHFSSHSKDNPNLEQILEDTFDCSPIDREQLRDSILNELRAALSNPIFPKKTEFQFARDAVFRPNLSIIQRQSKIMGRVTLLTLAQDPNAPHCCIQLPNTVWYAQGAFKQVQMGLWLVRKPDDSWASTLCALSTPLARRTNRNCFERDVHFQKSAAALGLAPMILSSISTTEAVDNKPIIVTKLYNAGSLNCLSDYSYRDFLSIFDRLTNVLAELHKNDIYHRDIKPDNVVCNRKNPGDSRSSLEVDLIDFGCATSAKRSKEYAGTYRFFSPDKFLYGRISCILGYLEDLHSDFTDTYHDGISNIIQAAQHTCLDEQVSNWGTIENDQDQIIDPLAPFLAEALETFRAQFLGDRTAEQMQKDDVFALGLTLKLMKKPTTQFSRYEAIPEYRMDCSEACQRCKICADTSWITTYMEDLTRINRFAGGDPIDSIIASMLHPNSSQRITAAQASEQFRALPGNAPNPLLPPSNQHQPGQANSQSDDESCPCCVHA